MEMGDEDADELGEDLKSMSSKYIVQKYWRCGVWCVFVDARGDGQHRLYVYAVGESAGVA